MSKLFGVTAALTLLTACGSEAPKPAKVEKPATLPAGEYEVVSEVTKLVSTDRTTPATAAKLGDKTTLRACVAADGTPDMKMFVDAGDDCTVNNKFVRSGRLSIQYSCTRPGKGPVYPNADGNYTADGYKAMVSIGSAFAGDGDYTLTRMLTARRVGACPAGAPAAS